MNLFGNKPEERALASLIHDTNSSLGLLGWHTKKLEDWVKEQAKAGNERGEKVSSVPFIALEYIKSQTNNIEKIIDIYYKKLEEISKTSEKK